MPGKLPNLGKLGPAELQAVYQDAKRRLAPHLKQRIASLEAEMRELETLHEEIIGQDIPIEVGNGRRRGGKRARTAGKSGGRLVGNKQAKGGKEGGSGKSHPLKGRKVEPKYRDPDNPSQTWAGRGQPPKWLTGYESQGRRREEFLIGVTTVPLTKRVRKR
jgi:DNA-binding protein H-NS